MASQLRAFHSVLGLSTSVPKIVYTTNMMESVNYQLCKVTRNRGHFPDDNAALKLLRLVARDINTTRSGAAGTNTGGWKEALNGFKIYRKAHRLCRGRAGHPADHGRCAEVITSGYTIVVDGEFTDDLRAAFVPADLTVADGATVLRVHHVDQAALHGIITRIAALGLTLLEVHREHEEQ